MSSTVVTIIIKVILAGVIAFFIYRDARARDFNWLLWMLIPVIGIFFTPGIPSSVIISLLLVGVYLLFRPKGALKPCPHCKKKIHDILAFCPFCRQSVKRECLRCHETVDWDATLCPHCRSANLTDS